MSCASQDFAWGQGFEAVIFSWQGTIQLWASGSAWRRSERRSLIPPKIQATVTDPWVLTEETQGF